MLHLCKQPFAFERVFLVGACNVSCFDGRDVKTVHGVGDERGVLSSCSGVCVCVCVLVEIWTECQW